MFPVPFNDAQRLEALGSYDVLDSAPEEALDCLTRLARRHFGVPIALVSLVDQKRQWFKSKQGLDACETPREVAFCAHAILSDAPLIVLDATQDARFASNPLVRGAPCIRFYAGAPLITQEGFRLGTFCVIGLAPRQDFTEDDVAVLVDLAKSAMQTLELHKQAKQRDNATAEAQLAENARFDVLSTVAHEVRAPIATLVDMANTLNSGVLGRHDNRKYEELSNLMAQTAQQVMNITDRTLKLASSRAGEVELSEEWISVRDLFETVKRFEYNLKRQPGAPLSFALPDRDIVFSADRTLVIQMLTNLATNALKYGEADSAVEICAGIRESGVLEFTVVDSGIGMSSEDIERALEPNTRIKKLDRQDPGGIGIGLPIVKRLVELHGGRLLIESVVDEGTRASLLFPPYRVKPADKSVEPAA